MSYDIRFKAKLEGIDRWVDVWECDANITWNVRKIIELSTGLEWKNEENNGYIKDIMPSIVRGRDNLMFHPEKYKPYEAENGWGTVESTARFFEKIINCWYEFGRWCDPEIVNVTTFWIE